MSFPIAGGQYLIAKWMARGARVFLLDESTRGISFAIGSNSSAAFNAGVRIKNVLTRRLRNCGGLLRHSC